jgi:leader peptidase (prepilin peptidase)/N-methyltransferase
MALAPAPLALLSLLPGLAIGSFLGVLAARMPLRQPVVRSRSACMTCDAVLAWYDNIPLLSFALLRGRCRRCRTPIPLREPAVELAGGLVIAGSVLAFGLTVQALAAAVFSAALVVVSATDLERRIVPNRVVLPAFVAVLVLRTIDTASPEWLLGALGASGFLLLAAIAYPGGMGMGDVKLALLLGAMLGRTVTVALMLATVLAFVPSALLLLRHRSAARKQAIPFAPFLAAGALIALFAGNWLLDAYLGALT